MSVNEFQNSNNVDTIEMLLIQTYSEPLFRLVGVVSLKNNIFSKSNLLKENGTRLKTVVKFDDL